jgi:hypothetical protein
MCVCVRACVCINIEHEQPISLGCASREFDFHFLKRENLFNIQAYR